MAKIGILPLARETFDVPFAREIHAECMKKLIEEQSIDLIGGTELLFDAKSTKSALEYIKSQNPDLLLILQVTFTDASMTVEIAQSNIAPIALWSFPEERSGGRLRLNSFCGINLASHALSRKKCTYHCFHGNDILGELRTLARASVAYKSFQDSCIVVVGEAPEGFDACNYNADEIEETFGISFHNISISDFIAVAQKVPEDIAKAHLKERKKVLDKLDDLAQEPLLNTMRIYHALDALVKEHRALGAAVRCWPQFFTDWGTAACGALAMMGEKKIPCGCEADVYGVLTSKLLSLLADDVVFNTDLVDIDFESDTCVFWHCGQAPIQMADPDSQPVGTIHTNRKLPLLSEFPLKPGQITIARLSRGGGNLKLVIGRAEMLKAPLAYAGTSGVARFERPIKEVMNRIIEHGLEHHTTIVYGDYTQELKSFAKLLQMDVVEL